ncbi:hypothetical protein M378DRAFT_1062683 [Amanita muscaria Koide BX008]|uniref:Uncharacterized protein n=1 Tax=Amanita muscaria (strain Koide BX008) TaxID=946122 RepID=A0A0C2RV04_AMAMK|nr:hypothetical protein M378DRAFT_1062683 [Amanita muscaria Koide BX008]
MSVMFVDLSFSCLIHILQYPGAEHQHYMQTYPGWNWAPPQMSPATQHPHQHPPSGPHTSGVPMSPRTQSPGTPTLSHAAPVPVSHPPPPFSHTPSSSMSSMSSPPPTLASALPDGRLDANSNAFVPGRAALHKKVVLKNEDGIEVKLETLTTRIGPTLPRKTAPIRIETPEQRQKRLEEEEQKEKEAKAKASAEEREKREKEEEERRKEEEDRKKKEEEERKQKEEEEKECLKEEEEKDRLRRQEEEKERLRREEDKERLKNPTKVSPTPPTASVTARQNLFATPTRQQQDTGPTTPSFCISS